MCYGLPHSASLGGETRQDVCLGVPCQRHESLCVGYVLLPEQRHVSSVAVYYHDVALVDELVEDVASLLVLLYDFQVHVVGYVVGYTHSGLVSSHDDDIAHVLISLLADNLPYVRYVLLGCHEVGEVLVLYHVHTAWYDCLPSPFYRYDVVWVVWAAEVFQRGVQYL